jgi:uncharacterized protein (DUF305 family)
VHCTDSGTRLSGILRNEVATDERQSNIGGAHIYATNKPTRDATMNKDHSAKAEHHERKGHSKSNRHYLLLAFMAVLSFVAMFVLMYAMVNAFQNVYLNVNQFYMAGLMAAPMVIIELLLMRHMYHNRKLNIAIIAACVIALAGFWMLIRRQTAVGDEQFLRSMIPHHAGAILMCEQGSISDPEIKRLCESIKTSQQAEIEQMKAILARQKSK